MFPIPSVARSLVESTRDAFTSPTYRRFVALMMGLLVTMGRRSVSRTLRMTQRMLPGHWCNYHRLYSSAQFSMWVLAAAVVRQVVTLLPADLAIELVADDTVIGKTGDRVWAKGIHRDPVRSSQSCDRMKFGHRWLVVCILVRLRGLQRPWALPILCGLCLSSAIAKKIGRRPKAPSQLTRQLVMRLMRWLPERKFILIGDCMVVSHATVAFAQRHAHRLTAIGRLCGDANLYGPPQNPQRRTRGGRLARKGRKIPSPSQRIHQLQQQRRVVRWYGGRRRRLNCVSEVALWYGRHQSEVTPIRWVAVLGDQAKGRDNAYFFSSDPQLDPGHIIELYASRWNIEVTFEEARAHLGLETTRHWCRQSILRVTPLILGLFTAVALLWQRLPARKRQSISQSPCYAKINLTFVDALCAVRREIWQNSLLQQWDKHQCLIRLPRPVRKLIYLHLTNAA